jgi:hypothetical protein
MGPVLKIFRCSNDFKTQKVYYVLAVLRVYVGLIMLAAFFVIPAYHKWSIMCSLMKLE